MSTKLPSRRPILVATLVAALFVGCDSVDVPSAPTRPAERAPSFDLSAPVVEICRGTASPCSAPVAQYTTATAPGSETIRVDAASQQCVVNWNTDQFTPSYSLTYRVRVLVERTLLGYVDVKLYGTGGAARNATTGTDIALVNGRTLPIKFRIETGAV